VENLKNWIETEARNFAGFAVTAPHKEKIREFLDSETEIVKKIGAVNTVSNIDGTLVGTNTDAVGALKAVLTLIDPKDKKVLILGAGGAAKAIAFGLKTAEAIVAVWNRTPEKAQNLAKKLDIGLVENLKEIEPIIDKFDIIINATSVGTKELKSVFPAKFWCGNHVAFDVVYDPLQTQFLDDAENTDAKIITGDKFLVYQAIEQFKVWHDIQPEAEVFEKAFFL
jgi:shikimate dehydrogenase